MCEISMEGRDGGGGYMGGGGRRREGGREREIDIEKGKERGGGLLATSMGEKSNFERQKQSRHKSTRSSGSTAHVLARVQPGLMHWLLGRIGC
jgi:hypothetical protein